MLNQGGKRKPTGGLTLDIRRTEGGKAGGGEEELSDTEQRIKKLFDHLGGSGKIKVYQILASGKKGWCGSYDPTEEFCNSLEETLAAFGPGEYMVAGHGVGDHIPTARIWIHERAAKTAAPPLAADLEERRREREEDRRREERKDEERRREEDRRRSEDNQRRTFEMFMASQNTMITAFANALGQKVATPPAPALPPTDRGSVVKDMRETIGLAKELDELRGGSKAAGPDMDGRSLLERVAEAPLTKMGERLVDKMMAGDKPAPAGGAAAPAPSPPVATPALPAPSSAPALPPGVKPFTKEQLAEYHAKRQADKATGGGAPAAPKAKDVLPGDDKK